MTEYMDGDYLVREHVNGVVERILISPVPVEQPVPVRRRLSTLAFRDRFTQSEKVAIYTASKTSVEVQIWLDDLSAATPENDRTSVDLDDPRTIAGVTALEVIGLIGIGRAAEILG